MSQPDNYTLSTNYTTTHYIYIYMCVYLQSWTKGWRQIDKIKQNRFFYGMVYS